MIGIQIILVLGFMFFLWWFLSNPTSHQIRAWTKILMLLFTLLAIIGVIFPDATNSLANYMGVKTGANLLLYLLTLAFVFTAISSYLKSKRDEKKLVNAQD
jgi:heme A synthase